MMDGEDAALWGREPSQGEDGAAESRVSPPPAQGGPEEERSPESPGMLLRQIDRWIASMERLRLADYVRYVDDRKRMFWTSFFGGVARGVGMAVGFTILGAVLVLVLQDLAKHNLPLIGDFLAQIVNVVQNRLK